MDSDWITPEEQVKIINSMVHKNDTLIHLGDVGNPEWISKLKAGHKVLIMGNHDQSIQKFKPYFDEVYGTDIIPMKPKKECFMSVIGDLDPSECVMIGDNLEVDIKVPYEMGMQVYHLNKFGTSKYPTIRKIEELKERL